MVTFDLVTITFSSLSDDPYTQTRSGMESAEQMQDYRRDFDAINEKWEIFE